MGQEQEQEREHAPVTSSHNPLPVVILNPAGDRGRAARLRPVIERALVGGKGDLVVTAAPRDAERYAREAAKLGRDVVAVGGDGTINEVASGILSVGAPITLGIVAAGSGNDYAYETLRLPRQPRRALELALAGTPVAMDVGQVNGRIFLNSLGVGIDANIAAAAETLKRYPLMRGQTLYWASSLHELLLHYDRCPHLRVTRDGLQETGRDFALAAVSIGPTYGGGFRINPDADPRDGYFDVCTIWKPPLLRALRLLPMVEKGRHMGEPEVSRHRVRHVVLESPEPVFAHLDGEVVRDRRFEAHVRPGALRVRQ
jgi:diacylglycerol kinase (ATP)